MCFPKYQLTFNSLLSFGSTQKQHSSRARVPESSEYRPWIWKYPVVIFNLPGTKYILYL